MTTAIINPEILAWARRRLGYDLSEVARRVHQSEDKVLAWETGEHLPTFRQAQTLADKLQIPFGYFYLMDPPQEEVSIPDLRTLGGNSSTELSPNFLDVLYDVTRKQEWFREYRIQNGEDRLEFIGRLSLESSSEEVAADIRVTLGIDEDLRRGVHTWKEYLRLLVECADLSGILVMRSGVVRHNTHRKLSIDEFRGFAIADPFAPVVFINSNDYTVSMIFTIAHELAHLWIGQSGISNSSLANPTWDKDKSVEQFCNKVAVEVLVPASDFRADWQIDQPLEERISTLARKYRVSSIVILRRAFELGEISANFFFQGLDYLKYRREIAEDRPQEQSGGGYSTIIARNSSLFSRALISATLEGRVLYREAASLFGVKKASTVIGIAEDMGLR